MSVARESKRLNSGGVPYLLPKYNDKAAEKRRNTKPHYQVHPHLTKSRQRKFLTLVLLPANSFIYLFLCNL